MIHSRTFATDMIRVEFLIGLHSAGSDNGPESVNERARQAIGILADNYSNFSTTRSIGYWRGGSEDTLLAFAIVSDSDVSRDHAVETARYLARSLAQECIGLSVTPTTFGLIAPETPRE